MCRCINALLIIFAFLLSIEGRAQKGAFKRLNVEQGLSHEWVRTMVKDSSGYLWFATVDGLDRFDGVEIKTFHEEKQDTLNTLSDFSCYSLFDDGDSLIWIGNTRSGLNSYNKFTGAFKSYADAPIWKEINSHLIRVIVRDQKGYLWLGVSEGALVRFDPKNGTFKSFGISKDPRYALNNNKIYSLLVDENKIWVGTADGGVNLFDIESETFTHLVKSTLEGSISNNSIYHLFRDSKGRIWVGTDNGLNVYDRVARKFKVYYHKTSDVNTICDNRVVGVTEDKQGTIWLATRNGLSAISNPLTSTEKISSFYNDILDNNSLSSNQLTYVMADNQDVLWVSTVNGGVNYLNLSGVPFTHVNATHQGGLSHPVIRAVFEDRDQNLWIGTDGGGLNLRLKGSNSFIHYTSGSGAFDFKSNVVLAIAQDHGGNIWIGTYGKGLYLIDYKDITKANKRFKRYVFKEGDSLSLKNDIVKSLFVDRDNRLWIGTDEGLSLYNRERDAFINVFGSQVVNKDLSNNHIQSQSIIQDSLGTIWIGTWGGLNKMLENRTNEAQTIDGVVVEPHSIAFKYYLPNWRQKGSISDDKLTSLFLDSHNNIWIGTHGRGLNRFDLKSESFRYFKMKDGLVDNYIYSTLEDQFGNIWASTRKGLSRVSTTNFIIKNFTAADGLVSSSFYWGASFRCKSGELIFGGSNGYSILAPHEIIDNPIAPPIVITNFAIDHKSIFEANGAQKLIKSVWSDKKIVLPYTTNHIEIRFAALNYNNADKNRYAFRLENLNNEWINVEQQRSATYTNVPPGEYLFTVRGSNNDGIWNDKGESLRIVITPPFWATWSFRVVLFILLIIAIWYWVHSRTQRITRQRNLLRNMVYERTQEINRANVDLQSLNKELNEVNVLLEETNEEVYKQNELVVSQRDEIAKKNEELEMHRNHLEELVTERTEELIAAKEKAEESERLKGAFLANMSHEIRTPLNAIVGFSNLLVMDSNTKEEFEEFSNQVTQNTEALLVLIDDILDLSLIEAKQAKCVYSNVDVNDYISNFFKYWETHQSRTECPIYLVNELADENLTIRTDEHKVAQIMRNLVGNACKFTEKGSITLTFKHENQRLIFSVKDTGIGIAPKHQAVIFEWFRKIEDDNTKLYRGTGLGLAISSKLSELLGGELWVESELGIGSTFYFSLPDSIIVKRNEL